MSYNTRRNNYNIGVNSIGQRRPNVGGFVHGGQKPTQQPPVQQQQPQEKPIQNVPQQVQQQQQQQQPRSTIQEAAEAMIKQFQQNQPVPAPQVKAEEMKPVVSSTPMKTGSATDGVKDKPFWIKKTGRIPRAERVRRRNMRLKKVLQPKNALMVLNELVGQTEYVVSDSKTDYNQDVFNATLSVEGQHFTGTGKSKVAAKTAAAEIAIRSIILKRLRNPGGYSLSNSQQSLNQPPVTQMETEEDEKMDEQQQNEDLSWSQIASFAIYKLLSNWDDEEGGNLVDLFSTMNSTSDNGATSPSALNVQNPEPRPAKKLPENAAQLNPSMLLNQMFPHTKYEEIARSTNPSNQQFTISCTIDGKTFTGTGPNKKTAKKNAAFEACRTLLNIEYPPEVYPHKMQTDQIPF